MVKVVWNGKFHPEAGILLTNPPLCVCEGECQNISHLSLVSSVKEDYLESIVTTSAHLEAAVPEKKGEV